MCSINPTGLFCKNCDFTLSVILGDPGSVSWVGKKGATKVFKQVRAWKLSLRLVRKFFCWFYFDIGKTVEPRLTATSLQRPTLYNGLFFWRTVHTLTLISTSLQRPLASNPKVAVVERFNFWQLSPEGEVIGGGKYREVNHRRCLCTDPIWGDSCFSNYQVSWIKKDSNFCK